MKKLDSLKNKELTLSEWIQELSDVDAEEVHRYIEDNGLLVTTEGYEYFSGKNFDRSFAPRVEKRTLFGRYKKQPIPSELRWAVWERDNFTCQKCGSRRNLTVDHIHPESKGGEMTMDNAQTLCKSCNSRKGSK